MTCSFFGHAQVSDMENLYPRLEQAVEAHIRELNVTDFLVGGMGQFDTLAARSVRQAQGRHSGVLLHLVIPYRTKQLQREKDYYASHYDDIVYPEELWGAHPKYAIPKRNRWMAERADCIIAYVNWSWGGAWTAMDYARRKKKPIVNLGVLAYDETR